MDEEHEAIKTACYTSQSPLTGKIIEVALWDEEIEPGFPIVTIATEESSMALTIQDLEGLMSSLESISKHCI